MKRASAWSLGSGALSVLVALSAACGDDAVTEDGEGASGAGASDGGADGSGASSADGAGTSEGGGASTGGSNGEGGGGTQELPSGELSAWSSTARAPTDAAHENFVCPLVQGSRIYAFAFPSGSAVIWAAGAEVTSNGQLSEWTRLQSLDYGPGEYVSLKSCTQVGGRMYFVHTRSDNDPYYAFAEPSADGATIAWSSAVQLPKEYRFTHHGGDLLATDGTTGRVEADGSLTWSGTAPMPEGLGVSGFVTRDDGTVYALRNSSSDPTRIFYTQLSDLIDGEDQWTETSELPTEGFGCPVFHDETLYVLTSSYSMFAGAGSAGIETQWTFTTPPPAFIAACAAKDDYLYAFVNATNTSFAAGTVFVAQVL